LFPSYFSCIFKGCLNRERTTLATHVERITTRVSFFKATNMTIIHTSGLDFRIVAIIARIFFVVAFGTLSRNLLRPTYTTIFNSHFRTTLKGCSVVGEWLKIGSGTVKIKHNLTTGLFVVSPNEKLKPGGTTV